MCVYVGYVVGVSDFLMMSLAKLTVAVGKQVKDAVADTEVHVHTYICLSNYFCCVFTYNMAPPIHLGAWSMALMLFELLFTYNI